MSNHVYPNYETGGVISPPFGYSKNCPLNEQKFVIPKKDFNGKDICWDNTLLGPTTVKHLYSEVPFNYEYIKIRKPIGILYDHNMSETRGVGIGKKKIIGSSESQKLYPLTNIYVREVTDYTETSYIQPSPPWNYNPQIETNPTRLRTNGWTR